MFRNILISSALASAALLAALPLTAATVVPSYNAVVGKNILTDDGIIVVAYPDGWNRYSEKRAKALIASATIRKAAGNAVLIPLPVADYTTEASKKAKADICGKLNVPGARSYPAFILMDREGKHYATLCGTTVVRGTDKEIADKLTELMAKGRERRRLLTQAEQTEGPQKARLVFDAYQIEGLSGWGKGFNGHIAKLDPEDKTGAKRAANYDHYGLLDKLGKLPPAEAMAEVDKLLADSAYTNGQKQQMCMAILGVLRRNGSVAQADDMRRYARKLSEYAPNSPHGRAGDFISRNWVPELSCAKGWSPASLPLTTKPAELMGKLPISEAGTYTVTFKYTKGRFSLNVLGVELYDGKKKVAEDMHKGSTGRTSTNNIYTLKVDKTVKEPHVFISVDMAKNRDSHGSITIEKL